MQPSEIRAAIVIKSGALLVSIEALLAGAPAVQKDITKPCNEEGASEEHTAPVTLVRYVGYGPPLRWVAKKYVNFALQYGPLERNPLSADSEYGFLINTGSQGTLPTSFVTHLTDAVLDCWNLISWD